MSVHRVLRKSTAATGDFLPPSEGGGGCKAFAISGTAATDLVITTPLGVTFTARTTTQEKFKVFNISAVSWTNNTGAADVITLF